MAGRRLVGAWLELAMKHKGKEGKWDQEREWGEISRIWAMWQLPTVHFK